MKKALFAFAFLLLAVQCSAASISVEERLPAGAVWSFSVTLPSAGNFDDAEVLLDGDRLAYFETISSGILVVEEDTSRLFSVTSPEDSKAYFLVAALEAGDHTIALEIDGSREEEEEVEFFEVMGVEDQPDLEARIDSMHGTITGLISQVDSLEEKASAALTQEDRQQLQSGIDAVSSSLSQLQERVGSGEEESEELSQRLAALADQAQDLRRKTFDLNQAVTGTGFLALPGGNQVLSLLVLVAAVVAIALLVKNRERLRFKKGLYKKHTEEQEEPVFSEKDEKIANEVLEESQGGKKGKWAFGASKKEEKEEGKGRFQLGDLIKK